MIKHTKVSDFALFGFSMGGGEVARYMSKYKGDGVLQAGLIASIVSGNQRPARLPEKISRAHAWVLRDGVFQVMARGKDAPAYDIQR